MNRLSRLGAPVAVAVLAVANPATAAVPKAAPVLTTAAAANRLDGMPARASSAAHTVEQAVTTVTRQLALCRVHGTSSVTALPDRGAPGGRRQVWTYHSPLVSTTTPAQVPVLYFLHGLPGSALDLSRANAAPVLDEVACALRSPLIVAAPDGNGASGQDTEWADDAGGAFSVESFVTGPLVRAVEGNAPRDRAHRAIFGFSMGGYGAVALALRHPQLYSAAASISGYFKVDDPDDVFGSDDADHDPTQLLPRASSVRLLLAQGAQDDQPVVRGELQRFSGLLHRAGIPVRTLVVPGGHSYALVVQVLPQVVQFLLGR